MSYTPSPVSLLPFYLWTWKSQWRRRWAALGAAGGDRRTDREIVWRRERRIDFHLQQLQFKASQQTSEALQDPACPQPGRAACLRAGLPPGARDSQAAPGKQLYTQRRKMCKVTAALLQWHKAKSSVNGKLKTWYSGYERRTPAYLQVYKPDQNHHKQQQATWTVSACFRILSQSNWGLKHKASDVRNEKLIVPPWAKAFAPTRTVPVFG